VSGADLLGAVSPPRVGIASDVGFRESMEDRVVAADTGRGLLVGVFDGHGGPAVADHAAARLADAVESALRAGARGPRVWPQVFARLDLELAWCGSTATVALLDGLALSVAWVGDSRAILSSSAGTRVLTPDHRIGREDERRRVLAAGATLDPPYVMDPRTRQGLMVTRALGDRGLRHVGIVAEPEVVELQLAPDHDAVLVVASDGLWDVASELEVEGICRCREPDAAARRLIDLVASRDGPDNVTAVVVWPGHPVPR
jgi:serine/threonine protein phosphatase PrpC